MEESDHRQFEGLFHHGVKTTARIAEENNKKRDPSIIDVILLFLVLISLATFIGYGCERVIFRKNPKLNWIEILSFIIVGLLLLIGGIGFTFADRDEKEIGSQLSFQVFGVLYICFAFYILIKGFRCVFIKHVADERSIVKHLFKDSWNERKVRNLGEPLLLIMLAIATATFNVIAAIPLMFFALSFWIHLGKASLIKKPNNNQNATTMYNVNRGDDTFHSVN